MNNKKQTTNKKTLFIVQSGLIAALYVALTWASNLLNLSYGSIQFRFSEILTILPVFTPAAIPGLTIGCFISNMTSPFGVMDMALGSFATLIASYLGWKLRNKTFYGLPVLSAIMPTIANPIAVGIVITISSAATTGATITTFLITFLQVALGELVMATIVGLILYKILKKNGIERIFNDRLK